jgi:hypothetical protein
MAVEDIFAHTISSFSLIVEVLMAVEDISSLKICG